MPPHVFLCAYNNRGYKNEKKRTKANQMKKAHIHGLSSHIYCVLINLMTTDKNTDVCIPLLNLNGMIRKKAHICDCLSRVFLCAKVKGNENKHIYMSFSHHIYIVCNLISRIKSNIVVIDYQILFYFYSQSKLSSSITF